jgi:hypothetical protein
VLVVFTTVLLEAQLSARVQEKLVNCGCKKLHSIAGTRSHQKLTNLYEFNEWAKYLSIFRKSFFSPGAGGMIQTIDLKLTSQGFHHSATGGSTVSKSTRTTSQLRLQKVA